MSYPGQTGTGQGGFPSSAQGIGSQIAGNQGGLQFENKPGASLSGGAAPERNTVPGYSHTQGIQEPGYENISAPSNAGFSQPQGGSTYNTSSVGGIGSAYNPSTLGGGSSYNPSSAGGYNPSSAGGYQSSSTGGQGTSTTVTGQKPYETAGAKELGIGSGVTSGKAEPGTASIGGGGINTSTVGGSTGTGAGLGSSTSPSSTTAEAGVYQQAKETAAPYIAKAQETAAPYVAKAQESAGPYVAKAQETAGPYVAKAQELGSAALESARPALNQAANVAGQAYTAAANELDARGINRDTTQQKLAEVGQTMKDYGAVGQQRAGEYFNQAVDQARNIGQDRENKSIVATIFGTVFLVWLAFGFSIGAVFALGVAGSIAAVLSRYSRGHGSAQTGQYSSNQPSTGQYSQIPSGGPSTGSHTSNAGVETHYPRPAHPDNSLNTAQGQ